MSKKIRPLTIDLDEELLENLVREGCTSLLGFKMCRFMNDYDVDLAEKVAKIRVCGGPSNIECECENRPEEAPISLEGPSVSLLDDTYREDDF